MHMMYMMCMMYMMYMSSRGLLLRAVRMLINAHSNTWQITSPYIIQM